MSLLPCIKRMLSQFRWVRWLAFLQMVILVALSAHAQTVKLRLLVALLVVGTNIAAAHTLLLIRGHRPFLLSGPVEGLAVLYAIHVTGGLQSEFYLAYFISIMLAARDWSPRGGCKFWLVLAPLYSVVAMASSGTLDKSASYMLAFRLCLFLLAAIYADALVERINLARLDAQESAQSLAAVNRNLDRTVQDLSLLQECSFSLSSSLELDKIAAILAESAGRITCFDNCSLVTLDSQGEHWDVIYSEGLQVNHVGQKIAYNRGLTGWVAVHRRGVVVADSRQDDRVFPRYRDAGLRSIVVVPLVANDRSVGILSLGNIHEHHFSEDHLRVLTILCSQAALAIENAGLYEKTRHSAITDELTGLHNYRYFRARFPEELRRADRHRHTVSLLMVDVDSFKRINDTYGHPIGDKVLRELASILRCSLRAVDIVCRTGGEEFSIILPDTGFPGATHVAQTLVEKVASHSFLGDQNERADRVTISVGVTLYPDEPEDELLRLADNRMYRAKNSGGNRAKADDLDAQASSVSASL